MNKKGRRTSPQPWTPFERAVPYRNGQPADLDPFEECWKNNRYTVYVREFESPFINADTDEPLKMRHLSIKRNDRNPLRDWRHLQRIKNELVGEGCEGVELYPAEDRLVDEANQYHLYVMVDPEFRFGFGGLRRQVSGTVEAAEVGAKQRPFESENETTT